MADKLSGLEFDFSKASTFEAEVVTASGGLFGLPAALFREFGAGPCGVMVTTPEGAYLFLGFFEELTELVSGAVVDLSGSAAVGERVRVAIARPAM
jgi:hypothetical protein